MSKRNNNLKLKMSLRISIAEDRNKNRINNPKLKVKQMSQQLTAP